MTTYEFNTGELTDDDVKNLRIGDTVYLTGYMFTARDEAHHLMLELAGEGKEIPIDPSTMALFHCGPVMKKNEDGTWQVIAAGPTTSARMEIFEYEFVKTFGTKIIIGKGGMGERTTQACMDFGSVYMEYTGGAGALAARAIKEVENVYWLDELGIPEAVWILKVERFGPLTVTIDTEGNNWGLKIKDEVEKNKNKIFEKMKIK